METVEQLQAHYKAVRSRINNAAKEIVRKQAEEKRQQELEFQKKIQQASEAIRRLPGKSVIDAVAEKYGITAAEILSRTAKKKVSEARHECVWILRTEKRMGFVTIGKLLQRDHSSTVHSYLRTKRLKEKAELADNTES